MKLKHFSIGAALGLVVLLNQYGYFNLPEKKLLKDMPTTWKASFEQLCVEDTASKSGCLCAVAYVEQSSPAAELNGEVIYQETKELLKGICLE